MELVDSLRRYAAFMTMIACMSTGAARAVETSGKQPLRDPLLDSKTGQPIVENVLRRLDDLYRSSSSVARIRMVVAKPRTTRSLEMKVWTRGMEEALIVIEKPARDAGTATLKVGDNLWNYFPKIARTIRIPPSMMLSSWMGSDFTNDDLVKEASLLKDFTAVLAGRSVDPGGPMGWIIDLKAKEGLVGLWARIEYTVSPDGTLPLRAKFYDRRDRPARTVDFLDVRELDGRRIPTRWVLVPADKEGHRTEMFYLDVDFDAGVPGSFFSLSRLEKAR